MLYCPLCSIKLDLKTEIKNNMEIRTGYCYKCNAEIKHRFSYKTGKFIITCKRKEGRVRG